MEKLHVLEMEQVDDLDFFHILMEIYMQMQYTQMEPVRHGTAARQ